jgi:hypothetical protein
MFQHWKHGHEFITTLIPTSFLVHVHLEFQAPVPNKTTAPKVLFKKFHLNWSRFQPDYIGYFSICFLFQRFDPSTSLLP